MRFFRPIPTDAAISPKHRLAVLNEPAPVLNPQRLAAPSVAGLPCPCLKASYLFWLLAALGLTILAGNAKAGPGAPGLMATLLKWTPFLLKGFAFNLLISFMSMGIGTFLGAFLGIFQISLLPPVRSTSWIITQFFRNSPWLVLLFYCMFMLPFKIEVMGFAIGFPDWVKSVIGLSLPVMANVSEIVRGAINSIPSGQWEAAESLAFTRRQQIWMIILPQCYKRMLPPWMNLYAILTMATVLASIVGVEEVMTSTAQVLAADGRSQLLVPIYTYILIWFFLYCYPIARLTIWLEKKYALKV